MFCAKANGLPSESRQIAHTSPGCTTAPPLAVTRSSAATRSSTAKYGSENESPGPRPRTCTPTAGAAVCVCQPSPSRHGATPTQGPTRPTRTAERARGRRRETRSAKHERAAWGPCNPTLLSRPREVAHEADRGRAPRLAAPAPGLVPSDSDLSGCPDCPNQSERRSGPIQPAVARLSAESHGKAGLTRTLRSLFDRTSVASLEPSSSTDDPP